MLFLTSVSGCRIKMNERITEELEMTDELNCKMKLLGKLRRVLRTEYRSCCIKSKLGQCDTR
jgi:hypothetical protein